MVDTMAGALRTGGRGSGDVQTAAGSYEHMADTPATGWSEPHSGLEPAITKRVWFALERGALRNPGAPEGESEPGAARTGGRRATRTGRR